MVFVAVMAPRESRVVAAALAALLTAVPLIGLNMQSAPRHLGQLEERVAYFPSLPGLPPPTAERNSHQVHREAHRSEQQARQRPRDPPAPSIPMPDPAGLVESLPAPVSIGLPQPTSESASAPIRLDPSVLRRANRSSKGEVQKLAEASGLSLRDESVSRSAQLVASIHSAKEPDCLAPNGGGSLLSVFALAYMAFNDQCK